MTSLCMFYIAVEGSVFRSVMTFEIGRTSEAIISGTRLHTAAPNDDGLFSHEEMLNCVLLSAFWHCSDGLSSYSW